jgi:hypothetical protein
MTTTTLRSLKDRDAIDRMLRSKVDPAEYAATDWFNYQRGDAVVRPTVSPTSAYGLDTSDRAPSPAMRSTSTTRTPYLPTEKALGYLNGLLAKREHSYTDVQMAEARADARKCSTMIDSLKLAPWRTFKVETLVEVSEPAPAAARLDFSSISDGNYAVRDGDGVRFYRVSTNGTWKNLQVRASDALYKIDNRKTVAAILHKIVDAGLVESRLLFVSELGRCCKCGRSLTNDGSRDDALVNGGFGPECVNK